MAAVIGSTEIGLKKTGSTVTVPNNPKAKLMFYLNCISTVLDLKDQSNLSRLGNYTNYSQLSEAEVDALVALCFLLSPDTLVGKVIFQDDDMCGNSQNAFYELSAVRTNMLLSESILIGGQTRSVKKIMFFKQSWLEEKWIEPMKHFSMRLAALASGARTRQPAVEYRSQPAIEYSRPSPVAARRAPPQVTQPYVIGSTEIGLKKTGSTVTGPNNPKARLMFYLSCITSVLDLEDESNVSRLKDYTNYSRLTEAEVDALVALCFLLSPDTLVGKVIFQDDDMCGNSQNAFYELSAVRTNMLLSESILIGGQTRSVKKIMFFKQSWLEEKWIEPMKHFSMRLAALASGARTRQPAVEYRSQPAIEYSRPSPVAARRAPPQVTQPYVIGSTEIGLKKTGSTVTGPNNPKARLMFYLSCITSVLDLEDESNVSRLKDYTNYSRLTEAEVDALVALCFLLSPDTLVDKVIFQDDDMCGDSQNQFYELSAVRTNMLLSESILIGGQTRSVKKIMFFKQIWLEDNWIEPMKHFSILAVLASGARTRQPEIEYRSQPAIEYSRPSPVAARRETPQVAQPYVPPRDNDCDDCCCTIL